MFYYPFDPRIHNFGNIGFKGAIHAELAPLFTKVIDYKAYNGRNIRQEIIDKLYNYSVNSEKSKNENKNENKNKNKNENNNNNEILDLCCGVGFSTAEYGIDTSPQMINKAKRLFPNKKFDIANAENYNPERQFDIVTSMFSFHEMPQSAHEKIIENSLKLAKKEIIILDISPDYESNKIMRNGEPYLLDYQNSIENTMKQYSFKSTVFIPKHVSIWNLIL